MWKYIQGETLSIKKKNRFKCVIDRAKSLVAFLEILSLNLYILHIILERKLKIWYDLYYIDCRCLQIVFFFSEHISFKTANINFFINS